MMHECSPGDFKHLVDPTGLIHSQRVGMMHECSTDEKVVRAAFMHHDNQGHNTFKQYAAHKEVRVPWRY